MFGLSASEHYKSLAFPEIKSIVYEEFITNSYYLPDEPKLMLNFMSTVFRHEKGHVYCIGNKVSRINPYFGEWELTHIPKQKINTIDTYRVKDEDGNETRIAVYMTHTMKVNSGMFFGPDPVFGGSGILHPFPFSQTGYDTGSPDKSGHSLLSTYSSILTHKWTLYIRVKVSSNVALVE